MPSTFSRPKFPHRPFPPPSFLYVRNYLLQDESRQAHTAKMEAATALLARAKSSSTQPPKGATNNKTPSAPIFSPSKNNSNKNKKRKSNDGVARPHANGEPGPQKSQAGGAPQATWGAATNPWTGLVQAWQMPLWRPQGPGLLGPRPVQQPALTTSTQPGPFINLNTYAPQ
jgi:hypothetical protein